MTSKPAKKTQPAKSAKGKVGSSRAAKIPAKYVLSRVLPGGYRVYDTPIEPVHTTRERIAEAVAAYKSGR